MMTKNLVLVLLITAFVIAGCGGPAHIPPSGAAPGLLYSSVDYPSAKDTVTNFNFTMDDIEILGPVSVKTSSFNLLGAISWGDSGYNTLLEKAKETYPEAEALINVNHDTSYTNLCFIIYTRVCSTISATAVKFKK